MADDWEEGLGLEGFDVDELLREIGIEPDPKPGLWDKVFQPVKGALGAEGNVGGQLLGLAAPEAYEQAGEELRTELGVTPESGMWQRAEALPNLGDVAAQLVPEGIRESRFGRITGPVSRMIGNALGAPTTYTPWVLGKVGTGIARGLPGYTRAANIASQTARTAELAKVKAAANPLQQAGMWASQHAMPIDRAMAVGALAYAPEMAQGIGGAAADSWRLAKEGEYGEALTVGASGALMAGLVALIGKGIMSSREADKVIARHVEQRFPATETAKEVSSLRELEAAPEVAAVTPEVSDVSPETIRPEGVEAEGVTARAPEAPIVSEAEVVAPQQVIDESITPEQAPIAEIKPEAVTAPEAAGGPQPQQVGEIREYVPAEGVELREPGTFEEGLPAEPAPKITEKVEPREVAPEKPEVTATSRKPIEYVEDAEARALEEGKARLTPEEIAERHPEEAPKAKLERDALEIGEKEVETYVEDQWAGGPNKGMSDEDVADYVARLDMKYGSKEKHMRLALEALRDELADIRNFSRDWRRAIDSPEFAEQVKAAQEDLKLLKAEDEKELTRIRREDKRVGREDLSPADRATMNQHEAIMDRLRTKGDQAVIAAEKGGLEQYRKAMEAFESGDPQRLADALMSRVNARMAKIAEQSNVNPKLEEMLGDVQVKVAKQKVPAGFNEAKYEEALGTTTAKLIEAIRDNKQLGFRQGRMSPAAFFDHLMAANPETANAEFSSAMTGMLKRGAKTGEIDLIRKETARETSFEEMLTPEGEKVEFEEGASFTAGEGFSYLDDVAKKRGFSDAIQAVEESWEQDPFRTKFKVKVGDRAEPTLIPKKDLITYLENINLKGKELSKAIWPGKGYRKNQLTALRRAMSQILGEEQTAVQRYDEINTDLERFYGFLEGKDAKDLRIDDTFMNSFATLWQHSRDAVRQGLLGKGPPPVATPLFGKLRSWAGVGTSVSKANVLAEVAQKIVESGAPGSARLKKAIAGYTGKKMERTEGLKVKLGELVDLDLAPRRTKGGKTMSRFKVDDQTRVFFESEDGGKRAVVQQVDGADALERFVEAASKKGLEEISVEGAEGIEQIARLRQAGLLGAPKDGVYPVVRRASDEIEINEAFIKEIEAAIDKGGEVSQAADAFAAMAEYKQGLFVQYPRVREALAGVQKEMGIPEGTEPRYLGEGAYNVVFDIGTDSKGRDLAFKMGLGTTKHKFIEDYVPAMKPFMLPPLKTGLTDGFKWRVERKGNPLLVTENGVVSLSSDLPARLEMEKAIATVNRLEDTGKIEVLDHGLETSTGVGGADQWVEVDGKVYLADRGVVGPPGTIIDPVQEKIWLEQQVAFRKPDTKLSPRQFGERNKQYLKAINEETNGAVAFDVPYDKDFQTSLGKATTETQAVLGEVLGEINEYFPKALTGRFGGVTASPYLRGQYLNENLYVNPMEALFQHPDDMRGAAESLAGTMIHEAVHSRFLEHTGEFHPIVDELKILAKMDKKLDKWVDRIEQALRANQDELTGDLFTRYAGEAHRARSVGGEGWRGAEGVRKASVYPAEGGATRAPDQYLEGAKDLETGVGPGVQRGGAVPEGVRGEAGELGEAAVARQADARQAAEPTEGLARGEEEGIRAAAEEAGEGYPLESAYRIMDSWKGTVPPETRLSRLVGTAHEVVRNLERTNPKRIAELAKGSPAMRKGGAHSYFNMKTVDGLSDRAKAHMTLWSELAARDPETKRLFGVTQTWDQIAPDVKKLLDTKSSKALMDLTGKKSLNNVEVQALRILGVDLQTRVSNLEGEFIEEQLKMARGEGNAARLQEVETQLGRASREMAHGLPMIVKSLGGVGRALQAAKKMARAQHPEAAMLQDMRANLEEVFRPRYKNKGDLDVVVEKLMSEWAKVRGGAANPEDWAAAYRQAFKFNKGDKFLEAYKAFLLGYKSRAANIVSNSLVQGIRELERTVAIGLEKAHAKLTGRESERYWGELKLSSMAMKHWATGAIPPWIRSAVDDLKMTPQEMSRTYTNLGTLMEDIGHQVGAIEGRKGEFVRFMFKGMNAEDALFKKAAQLNYYYRDVYRKLRKGTEGWEVRPGEDIYGATKRYVDDIEESYIEAGRGNPMPKEKAMKFGPLHEEGFRIAREETFQTELPAFMKAFQSALRKPGGKPFQIIFPFVRTPYNIAVQTIKRTPAGFLDVANKWADLTGPERMDALSKPMVGTAVGMYFLNEALQGEITGGGPIDPVDEANLRETGWRPYSVKAGDQWLSYQRFEPISSIIGMAADMAEGIKRGDFDQVGTGGNRLFSLVTENLTNKTFLSGLEGMSTAMSDPQRYLGRWLKQMTASVVPNTIGPIPFGHLAQAVDPVYRQTEPFTLSPALAKVPWASKALPEQYTPTGEVRKRPGTPWERVMSPVVRGKQRQDPTAVAAQMLDVIGSPPTPPKRYTYIKGVRVWYTEEQRKRLAEAQRAATKIIGTRLVRDPTFMRLPDNEDVARLGQKTKKQVVKKLYDRYRRRAVSGFRTDLTRKARMHEGGEAR